MCGDRGKKIKKLIIDKHLNVRKVSFASDEGRELIFKALKEHSIDSMPFFTDGERYCKTLEGLIKKPVKDKKGGKK